jgi:hypothetical protein
MRGRNRISEPTPAIRCRNTRFAREEPMVLKRVQLALRIGIIGAEFSRFDEA